MNVSNIKRKKQKDKKGKVPFANDLELGILPNFTEHQEQSSKKEWNHINEKHGLDHHYYKKCNKE